MNDSFDIRKLIITGAGVIIFLLAGTLAMFLIPSDKDKNKNIPAQSIKPEHPSQIPVETAQVKPKSEWFIYVTGAVKNPGVYKLSEDSRIFQAIDAAGGFTQRADQTSINLAEKLMDGVHVHVAQKTTLPASQNSTPIIRVPGVQPQNNIITIPNLNQPSRTQPNKNLIDINHASLEELQKLNGIGPALAKRIIEHRKSHGLFMKPEDLLQVKGIGAAKLKKMREQILIR